MKTYEDLNTAMLAAYTLINWVLANYDHTKVQTKLNVWQYKHTKEWYIGVTTMSEHSIVIPDSIKPNIPQVNEFECDGKKYTSKEYLFKIK